MGASLYNNNGQLSDPNAYVNSRAVEQGGMMSRGGAELGGGNFSQLNNGPAPYMDVGFGAPAGRWGGGAPSGNPYTGAPENQPRMASQQGPQNAGNSMQGMSPMGGNPYAQGSQPQTAMPAQNLGMGSPQQQPMQSASAPVPSASGQGDFGKNPWLQQQGAAMQAASNQNLQQNILPGIGQGAQASGMYGSSRQGVAEGQAMANAQTGLNSSLSNMYGQSYGQDQQYSLGQQNIASQAGIANAQMANQFALGQMNNNTAMRGQDQSFNLGKGNLALGQQQANNSYDLGLRSNDLGFGQLDANINQQNFSNQLAGANFGLGIYDRMNGYNAQGTNNGTQMQNTPINQFNGFNNNVTALAGSGGNNVVAPQGNVLSAGLGAGLGTYGMLSGGTPDRNDTQVRNWLNAGRD
jgi:hypothetical protein